MPMSFQTAFTSTGSKCAGTKAGTMLSDNPEITLPFRNFSKASARLVEEELVGFSPNGSPQSGTTRPGVSAGHGGGDGRPCRALTILPRVFPQETPQRRDRNSSAF